MRRLDRIATLGLPAWALLLGTLALVVRLPFLFGEHLPTAGGDSEYYLTLANGLLHGEGFRQNHFHTPGYPAFAAVFQLLPGRTEDALTVAQHLLGVAVVLGILAAGWRYFGKATALIAATLAAVTPVLVVHEHNLLPDFLFGVLVFAGALALAEACARNGKTLWLLGLTGVMFGLAAWVKPAGQFLFLPAPLALLFATRDIRRTLTGSVVVAVTMLVVLSPWLARNAISYGHPSMSVQGSATLFMRVFEVDGSPIPTDKPYGRFAREVQQRPDRGGLEHEVKVALVEERRLSEEEAFDVEKTLALTAIRREPGEYALGTWRELKRSVRDINGFDGSSALLDELDRTRPPVPESATTGIWEVARPLSSVWWLLSLNVVAGLLVLLTGEPARRRAGAALISVWVVVTLCTVLAAGEMWRFSIQLAPLTWLLGSAGAAILVSSVWSWLASRSRRPRAEGKQVSPT